MHREYRGNTPEVLRARRETSVTTLFAYMAGFLFLAAAATGAAMLRGFLKRRKVALGGALIHGMFAISGLILLALSLAFRTGDRPGPGWWGQAALIILILVGIGGGTLVYFHVWHRRFPLWLAFLHAGGAALGVILLWFGILRPIFA
jgi:hypothetical protein